MLLSPYLIVVSDKLSLSQAMIFAFYGSTSPYLAPVGGGRGRREWQCDLEDLSGRIQLGSIIPKHMNSKLRCCP